MFDLRGSTCERPDGKCSVSGTYGDVCLMEEPEHLISDSWRTLPPPQKYRRTDVQTYRCEFQNVSGRSG